MKMMKFLKMVLATVVGVIVFFLIDGAVDWLLQLALRIPYASVVLCWPAPFPLIMTLLPILLSILVSAFSSEAIGKTTKPLCLLIMCYFGYQIVVTLISGAMSWQTILASVIGIAISFISFR